MLLSQKCGGSQKDTDVVSLYFGKCYFDSIINILQQQKSRIKTYIAMMTVNVAYIDYKCAITCTQIVILPRYILVNNQFQ